MHTKKGTGREMSQPPIRLLVVGGNGFIGRHIIRHALTLGWSVVSLSLSLRPDRQDFSVVQYVSADISNDIALKEALGDANFQYVVNCGGYIDHTLFFKGGRRVFDTHFLGVLNLVECLNRDVLESFVNIGSSDEYGNNPAPQVESQREMPISPYAMGKVAATLFLQALHRTEQFPATTLRLFLTYGPGQDDFRFLPQIIKGCLEGRSFPTSSGHQLRDFCFIQDTVDAIFATLCSNKCRGEIINIGSGRPISIRQMIETVRRLIGKGTPRFGEIAYRPGENMELYADITKAQALIGWRPNVSLEIGLDKTIRWVQSQA